MTTVTRIETTEQVLKKSDPNEVADALRKVDLGTMLTPRVVTFASLSSSAAVDITTAASKAAATVSPALPDNDPTLPPIGTLIAGRITAGTAHTNPFIVTDAGGTPQDPASGVSVATLSADGKTLTFGAAVTGFVLQYLPRPATDLTAKFAPSTYTP